MLTMEFYHPDNDKRLQEVIKATKDSVSEVKLDENKEVFRSLEGVPFVLRWARLSRGSNFYHSNWTLLLPPNGWKIKS